VGEEAGRKPETAAKHFPKKKRRGKTRSKKSGAENGPPEVPQGMSEKKRGDYPKKEITIV